MPNNGKLFISHTHADNERCQPLLAALDAWQIDYWYDGQQLDAGQQLSPRLQEAILGRDVLLRICTTNTPNSYWMNLELSAFRAAQYQQRARDSRRISIDLVLDAAYAPSTLERADVSVLAANKPERVWLAELASALGKKQSQQQRAVSRRAFVSLGGAAAVTTVGLAGSALVVKSRNDLAAKPYPKPRTIPFSNPQTTDPRIRWYFVAGDETGAALALAGERLLLNSNDGVFALNAQDGSVLWSRVAIKGSAYFGLAVKGDTVYTSGSGVTGSLYALRVEDGSTLWTTTVSSTFGDLGFTFANDSIYMINDAKQVACYSAHDGSLRWHTITLHFSAITQPSPIADAAAVYVGTGDGQMTAFSVADGSRLWSFQTGGALSYTPALVNGVLYFGSKDSRLYAVNATDGSLKWRFDASQIDGAPEVSDTPAVVGNVVYVGLYANVVALNATTGELLWTAPIDGQNVNADVTGSPTAVGAMLYAPAEQYLYAFSLKTRQPLWRVATRPLDTNSRTPLLAGATAYWSGANGFIYALDTTV